MLSAKQENTIKFIRDSLYRKCYLLSIGNVIKECGIGYASMVAYNLNRFEETGYIRRHSNISWEIELLDNQGDDGRTEGIEVAEELTAGKQAYALWVKGDSIADVLIKDGDIVAVWIKEEHKVTLEKFFDESNHIRLEPANSQGKFVTVVRCMP